MLQPKQTNKKTPPTTTTKRGENSGNALLPVKNKCAKYVEQIKVKYNHTVMIKIDVELIDLDNI